MTTAGCKWSMEQHSMISFWIWRKLISYTYGGCNKSAENTYSSMAPAPTFAFVEDLCCPILDLVLFWNHGHVWHIVNFVNSELKLLTNFNNSVFLVPTRTKFCQFLGMTASVITHPHPPFPCFALELGFAHPSQTWSRRHIRNTDFMHILLRSCIQLVFSICSIAAPLRTILVVVCFLNLASEISSKDVTR
jgi:hypothetical protein